MRGVKEVLRRIEVESGNVEDDEMMEMYNGDYGAEFGYED
jgi:hypothetical protein